jgi:protein phosphatase
VLSADWLRALVSDDPADTRASADAFEVMYLVTDRRLKRSRLVVSDATNVTAEKRQPLLSIAQRRRRPAIAIVFDLPGAICAERNAKREDRQVPVAAIHAHRRLLLRSLPHLRDEGFDAVHVLRTAEEVSGVTISRTR